MTEPAREQLEQTYRSLDIQHQTMITEQQAQQSSRQTDAILTELKQLERE